MQFRSIIFKLPTFSLGDVIDNILLPLIGISDFLKKHGKFYKTFQVLYRDSWVLGQLKFPELILRMSFCHEHQ